MQHTKKELSNEKRFRRLHSLVKSTEPFNRWYATEILEFRRLYRLKYRIASAEEARALLQYVSKKYKVDVES